jgi:hypothetical protein
VKNGVPFDIRRVGQREHDSLPSAEKFKMAGLVEQTSANGSTKGKVDWPFLARCLSFGCLGEPATHDESIPLLETALERAGILGAYPFEIIAGTPRARYGARITLRLPAEKSRFLIAFGLDHHPWGQPEWVGFRIKGEGQLVIKAYHRVVQLGQLSFHEKLSGQLYPVMAALHEGSTETYLRYSGCCAWEEFVAMALARWPSEIPAFDFQPYPSPVPDSFCVSQRLRGDQLESVSLFADYRSLPDDETIRHLWSQDMTRAEREIYELTLAAVRSCGPRRLGTWHAMLSWTLERGGWHKAASLLFPTEQ